MQRPKVVATVSGVVLSLTLCIGCGVSGGGSAGSTPPKARDVTVDAERSEAVTADVRTEDPEADLPSPAATTTHQDGNLLVLEGDLSSRYKLSHGTTDATFARSTDAARPGLELTYRPSDAGYPGVELKPEGEAWDLSKYGTIQLTATNLGDKKALFACRVDNPGGWKNSNTEQAYFEPGERRSIKIIFGHQYGHKPAYPLDPSKVISILMFTTKVKDGEWKFLVEEIVAAGSAGEKPPVDPKNVRVKPVDGYVMGSRLLKVKATAKNGTARVATAGARQHVEARLKGKGGSLVIGPPQGLWDLSGACEVSTRITNTGDEAFTPTLQAASGWNRTRQAVAAEPLTPGQSVELTCSFVAERHIVFPSTANKLHGGPARGTGTSFDSSKATGVTITAGGKPATMKVAYVKATVTPVSVPDWLGKRPPVDGDWTMTLDEDFDGRSVNTKLWSLYGPNWWGDRSKTHWSKDNVIVRDGRATILFEKKTGWHNDNEKSGHKSDFAGGYLDSYGLWRQKYGYFESRMKLPVGPGLWPAFWLMPDLGPEAGPHWKRQSTNSGGMEFDIMEHLTGWGPYRYHVAMHWDGYQKEHKSNGADAYIQPDEDGYFTSGCLWLPGKLVYYCNGRVVASWESERICDKPMIMMFTMPVGGWSNTPFDPNALPMKWDIDYVRVWQLGELASEIDGYITPPSTWPVDQK